MANRLRAAAEKWSGGRIVAVLEGGYDLDGLAGGMTATLAALTGAAQPLPAIAPMPPADTLQHAAIAGTLAAHAAAGSPIPAAESAR
jgi:acetoin utilization deacetylase AcuC-like enzyme